MKKSTLYIIFLILAIAGECSYAQTEPFKGYRIEGDMLVFVFDKRDYQEATIASKRIDVEDLDIRNVVVSGEFNNWAKDKWSMIKINENIYELRKKLSDFTDEFTWEFKFVINNEYWAEPFQRDKNAVRAFENGHALQSYNLKMYMAYPDKNGNVTFRLNGYDDARKVVLSGSFNKWNKEMFIMTKAKDGWTLTLKIRPGEYQYKFIVDGNWIEDSTNPRKVLNEFNGFNSLIDVKGQINFILDGFLEAKKVILAGSFNNWSESECQMTQTKTGWINTLMLSGGKHHYKFIVDGEWTLDPGNPVKEYDGKGNINSVCMVK
ncbi:hypothetical protein [Aquimarina sp. Aq78]|uniref:hypothetical protein n=1 Tax=Aquimarina sp. Aq78 TaxID=1191889 RepID=UPI000D102AA6|nr:hypothetical protein [Aquimarina sp. Aq78]